MMRAMIGLLALLLAQATQPPVVVTAAQADAPPPPATMVVEPVAMAIVAFDSDGDGRTARAEMNAGLARTFAAADPARSGRLGYIAFADWALRWLGDRNALPSPFEVDRDGDNAITLDELQTAFGHVFDRLDRDHDGYVTRAEALTIRATVHDERFDRKKKR